MVERLFRIEINRRTLINYYRFLEVTCGVFEMVSMYF